jgi:hypothetical protein
MSPAPFSAIRGLMTVPLAHFVLIQLVPNPVHAENGGYQ